MPRCTVDSGDLVRHDSLVVPADGVLEAMVDEGDLDGLFACVSIGDVAAAWCRYASRVRGSDHDEDDRDWWAIALLKGNEIYLRRDLHRALLVELVDRASECGVLGAVGAGPIEDFLSDDEEDLRWLERECSTNPNLRQALSSAWAKVSEATFLRLDAAAGASLDRPNKI